MKILYVSAEVEPFAKTGGLGDVLGALPKAMAKQGHEVAVMMPKYKVIPEKYTQQMEFVDSTYIDLNWRNKYCGVLKLVEDKVTYYFIDNEYYYFGDTIYDYADLERFSFFSKACLSVLPMIGFKPDIIHANDWSTALVPVFLDTFRGSDFYKDIRTVFTIHNLKYQGNYDIDEVKDITGLDNYYFTDDKLEFFKRANLLKGGVIYSDEVTTVSPSYAEEIKTPYYGEKLEKLMQARSNHLHGILNGVDYSLYNPEKDKLIYKQYSKKNYIEGKKENKKILQEELGLEQVEDVPMIAIISRFVEQKGFDLIARVINELSGRHMQLVILGTGVSEYENMFKYIASIAPQKVSANIRFNNALAHKIYAAADLLLMPSQFEPCGLSQIIAMKYGTVPIVRETGGLRDTVKSYNEYTGEGNGFSFANYNAHDMLYTIDRAMNYYYERRETFNHIIENGLNSDYSWDVSAKTYEGLYANIVSQPLMVVEKPKEIKEPKAKKAPTKKTATKKAAETKVAIEVKEPEKVKEPKVEKTTTTKEKKTKTKK